MASYLPIDNATIDGNAIATSAFVHNTGRLTLNGDDVAVTTADGRIHNIRKKVNARFEFQAYGDQTALETAAQSLGVTCVLKRDSTTVKTGTAVASARYENNQGTTTLSGVFNPSDS